MAVRVSCRAPVPLSPGVMYGCRAYQQMRCSGCGPGLDYMMDILPMQEVVAMVLTGSGECAEIDFMLLGLSLPPGR